MNPVKKITFNYIRSLLLCLFVFFSWKTRGQDQGLIDSLVENIREEKTDTQKVNTLVFLSKMYWTNDPVKGRRYAGEALDLSKRAGFLPGEGKALNSLGNICYQMGEYKAALQYHKKALRVREKVNNKVEIAASLNNIGNCYNNTTKYDSALLYYNKCAHIDSLLGDKYGLSADYNNIGNVYGRLSDYERSLQYLLASVKIKQEIGDKYGESQGLMNIGTIYKLSGQVEKAMSYYRDAMKLTIEIVDKYGLAYVYNNIGALYFNQKNNDSALKYFNQALTLTTELEDKTGMANAYANLGKLNRELGKSNEALGYFNKALKLYDASEDSDGIAYVLNSLGFLNFGNGKYAAAIRCHLRSLGLAKESGVKERMKDCYEGLFSAYAALNDFTNALAYQKLFSDLTDSIFTIESGKQMADMETKFQTEKKEEQIKLLNKTAEAQVAKLEKQKVITFWVLAGVLVFLISGFWVYSRFRLTQKQKKIIEAQKIVVDEAYSQLHEKNKEILDSIFYARRIQRALITSEKYIRRNLGRLNPL